MYLYEEIRNELIRRVDSMSPHARIPSRLALCKEYMATRTTIDRALSELVQAGYLYTVTGSGTFVSDLASQSIALGRNERNIGVLLPDITADTYPAILRGIQDVAELLGLNVVVCNTDNRSQKQASCIKRLINGKVEGLIIIPAINRNADYSLGEALSQAHVPYVFCNRNIGGSSAPCVCSNDFYGSFLATAHLISRGYRRIAYLSAVLYKTSMDRYQGYLAALCDHNLAPDEALALIGEDETTVSGTGTRAMLEKLLRRDGGVDAVVCFNDRVACDAMEAIAACGRRVSQDVGVIGYDNTGVCQLLPVKLTSMDYRNYEIGQYAANLLFKRMSHPQERIKSITTFSPQIVVRDSCLGPERD